MKLLEIFNSPWWMFPSTSPEAICRTPTPQLICGHQDSTRTSIVPPIQWTSRNTLELNQFILVLQAKRFVNRHSLSAVLDDDYPVIRQGLQVALKHEMGRSVGSVWPCNQYRIYWASIIKNRKEKNLMKYQCDNPSGSLDNSLI